MAKKLKIKRIELYKNHSEVLKLRKDNYPSNAWEYIDWLYTTGRLTVEEHSKLKKYVMELEQISVHRGNQGDCGNCDGCEQGYSCEYPSAGC